MNYDLQLTIHSPIQKTSRVLVLHTLTGSCSQKSQHEQK